MKSKLNCNSAHIPFCATRKEKQNQHSDQQSVTSRFHTYSFISEKGAYSVPNVPDEESPLASGMAPAREAESAGDMPEVPKGRGFAPSAR